MKTLRVISSTAAVMAAALTVVACGGEQTAQREGTMDETPAATALEGGATVSGMIMFTGTPPANPAIDMEEEPTCARQYADSPHDPRVVVTGGHLANVFVYVKSGLPASASYAAPATPVTIDQQGCLYHPRVLGLMVGQQLEIQNSDSVLHNIKAVPQQNRGFNVSQPAAGMTTQRTFSQAEIMVPLECNVHGWMQAWVGVLPHPFFSVSGEDGRFALEHLPPGTYTLEAWHETLGTQTATVTVADTAAQAVDFTFGAN